MSDREVLNEIRMNDLHEICLYVESRVSAPESWWTQPDRMVDILNSWCDEAGVEWRTWSEGGTAYACTYWDDTIYTTVQAPEADVWLLQELLLQDWQSVTNSKV